MRIFLLALAACALSLGCREAGDPCTLRPDGRDPCNTRCLNVPMNCPDGAHTNPGVCAGARCETQDDCVQGWLCLPYEQDESVAFCAPAHVCGA